MASDPRPAKVADEIRELQRLQMKSIASATFGGWTNEQVAAHDKRAEPLALLIRELDALDGTVDS
jgi:hypothetical protein